MAKTRPLPTKQLRWRCSPRLLPFRSTAKLDPPEKIIGQGTALAALRFGLSPSVEENHVFVRGLSGTGRSTLVERVVQELGLVCGELRDRCYVHNFQQPDRPTLITLPAGQGDLFRRQMDRLARFVEEGLPQILGSETVSSRRKALEKTAEKKIHAIIQPFEDALGQAGLGLVTVQSEASPQKLLFPIVDGAPVAPEEFERLHSEGNVPSEVFAEVMAQHEQFRERLEEVQGQSAEIQEEFAEQVENLFRQTVLSALQGHLRSIRAALPYPSIHAWLDTLLQDLMDQRLVQLGGELSFTRLYRVNVVVDRAGQKTCPVVVEISPSLSHLLGAIDPEFGPNEEARASHMGIRAGALLQADGGYLILEARDLLAEPLAWKLLVRSLRTNSLEIRPPDTSNYWSGPALKPEAIDIRVKVVLIGDSAIYYLLDDLDADFGDLFKVLADFEESIENNAQGAHDYAAWVGEFVRREGLPDFSKSGVAALVEHGVRVAADGGRLTARFGRMADVVREAAWLAQEDSAKLVKAEHVETAVQHRKDRANSPSKHFRRRICDGTVRISTKGAEVGQVNGLAVMSAGEMTYGFPARITATIGPGSAGVINIERESALSGAIHTKGFYILGGCLRHLLRTDHPLAFDASVAFEQSYGGIDGDSASGAEICCLLSALTGVELRQDVAMTGAIDHMGNIMAIGAVNEKIEGFYDICADQGLTGSQGVIIPRSNARDLQLRQDVVDACKAKRFSVWAVNDVGEALQIFTGMPTGSLETTGDYKKGTLQDLAMQRAFEFWAKAAAGPPPVHGPE